MSESSKFKISVWSEFVPPTALLMPRTKAEGEPDDLMVREYLGKGSGLQKEVHSWRMFEDAFGGIADPHARSDLEEKLLAVLSITARPEDRRISALQEFVRRAHEIIEAGGVEWSDSQTASEDSETGIRLNPLLALVGHLSWLVAVFDEQPGISVTVR